MQCEKCGQETETVVCRTCRGSVVKLGPFCYLCGGALEKDAEKAGAAAESADAGDTIDFSSRILCSDGTCIGVINEQGVCKVCGKPYAPEQ
jgi:hypothetical protein